MDDDYRVLAVFHAPLPRSLNMTIVLYVLCVLYFSLLVVAFMQLVRIHLRRPELGVTTQKTFLLFNTIFLLIRCIFFGLTPATISGAFFSPDFQQPVFAILADLPANFFFTTFTLLALFWSEILAHTRSHIQRRFNKPRRIYIIVNICVYSVQAIIWIILAEVPNDKVAIDMADNFFHACIALLAAVGLGYTGIRLYRMLNKFPIEAVGRREKLREVGLTTIVSIVCCSIRALMTVIVALDRGLDDLWYFIFFFFFISEVVPCILVMYILRRLPPKKQDENAGDDEREPLIRSRPVSEYSISAGSAGSQMVPSARGGSGAVLAPGVTIPKPTLLDSVAMGDSSPPLSGGNAIHIQNSYHSGL